MIESLEFFALGIAFGSAGGLSPGPTTTLVIAQTLLREGLKIAIAPLLTDAPIVLLAIFAMSRIETDGLLATIAIAGAAFLLYLAYESFSAQPPDLTMQDVNPGSLRKGFLANFFNPHPWMFWMFWMTVGGPKMRRAMESSAGAALLFIVAKYACLVGAKMLIALAVERGRGRRGRAYSIVMKLLAAALVVFAILFLREAFDYLR